MTALRHVGWITALLASVLPPVASAANHISKGASSTQHVIVLVQENRSFDNLLQGFPGADTQSFGFDSNGRKITLTMLPLGAAYDPAHNHVSFVDACNAASSTPDQCRMNGFDKIECTTCPPDTSYTYVQPSDIVPYVQIAKQYALADHVLQPNEGGSFSAHIYLIAGQAGQPGSHWYVAENPTPQSLRANCLSPPGFTALQIDMTTAYPGVEGNPVYPCVDTPTLLDELDRAHIGWRYYTPTLSSLWTAPLAISHLAMNVADYTRVITPETTVLTDIRMHTLPPLSYVVPNPLNSDHPGLGNPDGGPAWVASIVNAVGTDPTYWKNTTILVVWDDWGGWFDHVAPVHAINPFGGTPDPYEYGFRVPLMAIGAYVKPGYVSHRARNAASVLTYIEKVFGLPSLGRLDAQTDDLSDLFTSGGRPRIFKRIPIARASLAKILHRPPTALPVDEE